MEFVPKPCKICGIDIPRNGKLPSAYNRLKTCSQKCKSKAQETNSTESHAEKIRKRQDREARIRREAQRKTKRLNKWMIKKWPKCTHPACIEMKLRFHFLRDRVKATCREQRTEKRWCDHNRRN